MVLHLSEQVEEIKESTLEGVEKLEVYAPITTRCKDFSVLCKVYRVTLFYIEGTKILAKLPLSGVCGFEPYLKSSIPNYEGYDSCFSSVKEEHQKIDTAISRLYYPYQLSENYRKKYEKYLWQKYRMATKQVILEEDMDTFYWIFKIREPDVYMIHEFKEAALLAKKTQIVLFLMNYEREHFIKEEEKFEL